MSFKYGADTENVNGKRAPLAGKAFGIDWIRAELDVRGATSVIPPEAGCAHVINN